MDSSQLDLLRLGIGSLGLIQRNPNEQPNEVDLSQVQSAYGLFLGIGRSVSGIVHQAAEFYSNQGPGGFQLFLADSRSVGFLQEAYELVDAAINAGQPSPQTQEDEDSLPIEIDKDLALEGNTTAQLASLLAAYQDHLDQLPKVSNQAGKVLTLTEQIRLAQMAVARREQAQKLYQENPELAKALLKSVSERDPKATDPTPTVRHAAATALGAIPNLSLDKTQRALTQEYITQLLVINPKLDLASAAIVAITTLGFDQGQENPLFAAAHATQKANQEAYQANLPDPEKLFLGATQEQTELDRRYGRSDQIAILHGSSLTPDPIAGPDGIEVEELPSQGSEAVSIDYDERAALAALKQIRTHLSPGHLSSSQLAALDQYRTEITKTQAYVAGDTSVIAAFKQFVNPIGLSDVELVRAYYLQSATPEQLAQIATVLSPAVAGQIGVLDKVAPALAAGSAALNLGLDETKLAQIHAARAQELQAQSVASGGSSDSYLADPLLSKIKGLQKAVKAVKNAGPITQLLEKTPLSRLEKLVYNNSLTRFLAKTPAPVRQFVSIALNPMGHLQARLQLTVGRQISTQLYKAFRGRITNPFARQIARATLSGGTQKAAKIITGKIIAKLAATKVGQFAAKQAALWAAKLGLASTGVGAIVAAAIQIAEIAWEAIKFIGNRFQDLVRGVSGESWKKEDTALLIGGTTAVVVAAPVGLLALPTIFFKATKTAAVAATGTIAVAAGITLFVYLTALTMGPILTTIVHLESGEWNFLSSVGGNNSTSSGILGPATNSCANTAGTFVFQRDPAHARVFCKNCATISSGENKTTCNIGGSGCGSASMTMILRSFGAAADVVSVWHRQHEIGGYAYSPASPPYYSCGTDNSDSLNILRSAGLQVVETTLSEAPKFLQNCGLILATGKALCGSGANRGLKCGHLIVIKGIAGNQLITLDPDQSNGDGYVHTIGQTYAPVRLWAVTK